MAESTAVCNAIWFDATSQDVKIQSSWRRIVKFSIPLRPSFPPVLSDFRLGIRSGIRSGVNLSCKLRFNARDTTRTPGFRKCVILATQVGIRYPVHSWLILIAVESFQFWDTGGRLAKGSDRQENVARFVTGRRRRNHAKWTVDGSEV